MTTFEVIVSIEVGVIAFVQLVEFAVGRWRHP
jgi:hypothetical protein